MRNRYEYEMLGFNFRLTDVMAAIGIATLGRMDEATRRRTSNAAYLSAHSQRSGDAVVKEGRTHVWHQYTIRLPHGVDRNEVAHRLGQAGIWDRRVLSPWRPPFPHISRPRLER